MNTDQDIIQYLKSYSQEELMESSALFFEITQLLDAIDTKRNQNQRLTPDKIKKINSYRLMSSNTLNTNPSKQDLATWNQAQNFLFTLMSRKTVHLELADIVDLNAIFTGDKKGLRDFEIKSGAGYYLEASIVSEMLEQLFTLTKKFNHPLRIAFEIYLGIATIHPFKNANGRTARLCGDYYLLRSGYLPVCFVNSYQSHVALIKNNISKTKDNSFIKYLKAILRAYQLIEK